jgi:AGZA family xanthine/uracil permease-like MFS transporter
MSDYLTQRFQLTRHGTTIRREALAGATTYLTLSYIFFVQPVILQAAGMDAGAVLTATCLASAAGTLAMGFWANYPIALAPGMGHNVFFAYTVCVGMQIPWQTALGAICIAGTLFILLSIVGFREKVIQAIPASLKRAIAVGIGLLIAFVGFQWGGVIVQKPGTLVGLGDLTGGPVLLTIAGFLFIAGLMTLRMPGALLIGIVAISLTCLLLGYTTYKGVLSLPPSLTPTLFQLDLVDPFRRGLLMIIFVFLMLDLFDTVGTLVGVGEQAGFMRDGQLPNARPALLSDAVATVAGALTGTSTVTSYIESAAGVAAGGRTGLANVFTAGLMVLTLFFYPLIQMVGQGLASEGGMTLYPALAPVLILVGILMMRNVTHIDWEDMTEAIPSFLTIIIMPFSFSITEGIAFGFIAFVLLKLLAGRRAEIHPLLFVFATLFIARYIWMG